MATRESLKEWVVEALRAKGGSASIAEICKHIWQSHEPEIRNSGDLLYKWQYDMRWAGQVLRNSGVLQPKSRGDQGPWRLAE